MHCQGYVAINTIQINYLTNNEVTIIEVKENVIHEILVPSDLEFGTNVLVQVTLGDNVSCYRHGAIISTGNRELISVAFSDGTVIDSPPNSLLLYSWKLKKDRIIIRNKWCLLNESCV